MSTDKNSFEARKEALNRTSEIYKQAIDNQVVVIKENAGQVGKTVLLAGAGLAVAYLLIKVFTKSGNKSKHALPYDYSDINQLIDQQSRNPSLPTRVNNQDSPLVNLIKQQIAIFLVGIAKQRLQEALQGFQQEPLTPNQKDDTGYSKPVYIE